jgi:protease I
MAAFVPAMLDAFDAKASSQSTTSGTQRESDPQLSAPPGVAVAALRWLPKPSAVAALTGVGLAAYAGLALNSPLVKMLFAVPRAVAGRGRDA